MQRRGTRTEFALFGYRIVRGNLVRIWPMMKLILISHCSFLRGRIAASHRLQEKLSVNGRQVSRKRCMSSSYYSVVDPLDIIGYHGFFGRWRDADPQIQEQERLKKIKEDEEKENERLKEEQESEGRVDTEEVSME